MELFERESGGETRLLFVHGWQGNRLVWRDVIAALGRGIGYIDVDLRGSGELREIPGPYSVERYAADLRELIEASDSGPVVVVGHSMGAKVALQLAHDAPGLVRGLVLIAPVPAGPAGFSEKGLAGLRATAGDPERARAWLSRTFAPGEPPAEAFALVCASADAAPPGMVLESLESWTSADLSDAARGVTAPALVISAEHDNPENQRKTVAALLPNARFEVIPGAGHYVILERPGEVARLIREFVTREN